MDEKRSDPNRWRRDWSYAALKRNDVPAGAKVVYQYLLNRLDRHRRCWPSHPTIARDCGMSRRNVQFAIDTLRRRELLSAERATTEITGLSADKQPNLYTLKDPSDAQAAAPRDAQATARRKPERRAIPCANDAQSTAHKQVIEQVNKSKSSGLTAAAPPRTPETGQHKAMFGAIAEAFGYPLDALDNDERKRIGKIAKRLIAKKAVPEDVAVRKKRYAVMFGAEIVCSIEALGKWWHDLGADKTAKSGARVQSTTKYGDASHASTAPENLRLSVSA